MDSLSVRAVAAPSLRVHHDTNPQAFDYEIAMPGRYRCEWYTEDQWQSIPPEDRNPEAWIYPGQGAAIWTYLGPLNPPHVPASGQQDDG
jgi:hypothetical protein